MSTPESGLSTLEQVLGRLGISANVGSRMAVPPETLLGAPLDTELRTFYQARDGVLWSAADFYVRIYPLTGPDSLEWRNVSQRRSPEDYIPPYPFDRMIVFAQYGRRASYLATVPSLADEDGRQPVIYVDTSETVWAVPIASSVDRLFALIANYLEEAMTRYGRDGLSEMQFPLDVPRMVGKDEALASQVRAGSLADWVRADDPSIQDWFGQAFGDSLPT